MMEKMLKTANLAAIVGTSWMALLILLVMFYRGFLQALSATSIGVTLLTVTELVFAVPFLLFLVCFYLHERAAEIPIVPRHATALGVVGSAWMVIVAVLHRLPGVWRWIAMQQAGLLVGLTQIIFTLPLLFFFIVFGTQQDGTKRSIALRLSAIAAAIAMAWSLVISASHLSAPFLSWLIKAGVSRFFIITEPFMAFSLLFFLVIFYFDQPVEDPA